MAVHVLELPYASVAVSVTVLLPASTHVNVVGLTESIIELVTVQASLTDPRTSSAVIVTVPPEPSATYTVVAVHVSVGLTVSLTVTDTVQLAKFPLVSVTVIVTVLDPMSEHVNDALLSP
jgi:hypothetical protein